MCVNYPQKKERNQLHSPEKYAVSWGPRVVDHITFLKFNSKGLFAHFRDVRFAKK